MGQFFHKRYFKKPKDLFISMKNVLQAFKETKSLSKEDMISEDFSEKIMLAVTGVNSCSNCSYLHTKTALEKGVSSKEIRDILAGEFGEVVESERIALLYAEHWADSSGNPSQESRRHLAEYYGDGRAKYIESYIRMVNFGNMVSNSVEAHNKKVKAKSSTVCFCFVYLLCLPVYFFIKLGGRKVRNKSL